MNNTNNQKTNDGTPSHERNTTSSLTITSFKCTGESFENDAIVDDASSYLLIYCEWGHGLYMCNDNTFHFGQGQYIILNESTIHKITLTPIGRLWSIYVACFTYTTKLAIPLGRIRRPMIDVSSRIKGHDNLFQDIYEAYGRDHHYKNNSYASSILLYFIEAEQYVRHNNDNDLPSISCEAIDKAIVLMKEHVKEPLSIDDICQHVSCSKSKLFEKFNRNKHVGPLGFFYRLKMDLACELLLKSDMPVNRIGKEVGFDNHSQFTKLFKKMTGMSPTEFRKRAL